MNFRTDFTDEIVNENNNEYKKETKQINNVKMTTITIKSNENSFNKKKGKYISLDFNDLYDNDDRIDISEMLITSLKKLYTIKEDDKILIVGLGNQKIIADSLGPNVADKIIVTNHLYKIYDEEAKDNINRVCVFTPKVMGQTGLESADLVIAVNKLFKANLIIVIDALATNTINRVNKVIQLSDTGIAPGSGVGNYRKEISNATTKCKVIAIGVATVVEANSLFKDIKNQIILTPKDIDEDIEHLSTIIATSINKYVHKNYKHL